MSSSTLPPSPGATRAAGVLTAGVTSSQPHQLHSQQQYRHPQQQQLQTFYPHSAYPSYSPVGQSYPQHAPGHASLHEATPSTSGNIHYSPSSQQQLQVYPHPHHTPTSYSPTVFAGNALAELPLAHFPPPPASDSVTSRRASIQQQTVISPQASTSIVPATSPLLAAPNLLQGTPSQAPGSDSTDKSKKAINPPTKPESSKPSPKSSTPNNSSSKKKPTRRYNASCDACRARKRKCPGRDQETGKSLCTACADRGIECTYGSLGEPSRLRRADNENESLRKTIANALQAESAREKDSILATITEKMLAASSGGGGSVGKSRRSSEGGEDYAYSVNKRFKEDKEEDGASPTSGAPTPLQQSDYQAVKFENNDHVLERLHHADHGTAAVNGVPSPRPSSDEETAQFTQSLITSEQNRGNGDSELDHQVSYYIGLALPHGDFQNAPSPQEDHRLLEFYFSWLNPRYALLSRKLFEQSRLLNDGAYCTPFLLWSLYAHAAMHCPGFEQQQAHYRARAHLLVTKEFCKVRAATLPLAQGLILLAGTAAAKSDHSLAWTLSFTVTGIVIDLLETMDQSTTENERKMRKRLYWSHYVWSLVLALALNRKPSVPKLKVELPVGNDESELWVPALPVRHVENAPQIMPIPRLGYEIECFREICQLFSFLDEILTNVYVAAHDKRSPDEINQAVKSIQERMTTWQTTNLSSNILLNAKDLPPLCPPPHIIHFNLLLRSIWILLYRPFFNMGTRTKSPIKGARQACNQCASEIYAIFLYLEQNFGVLQLHFSYIYAAYWAAAIDVATAKREGLNPELLARLSNSSRILLTWVSLPGMKQSVSELIEQIEALLVADVPRSMQSDERFSAYDPMQHHPNTLQEARLSNQQQANNEVFYPQLTDMFRPVPPQDFINSDPMMGVSAAVDYAPLGGIYWDTAGVSLW